jgi:asparagine synthase (glutamine-hydrolysing)
LDRVETFSPEDISRHYWGAYIGFDDAAGATRLIRDPRGSLPCYYVIAGDTLVAASDVRLMIDAGLLKASVAWGELPRYLLASDLPADRTALEDVHELLPGACLSWNGKPETSLFWSPWDYVSETADTTDSEVAERLRRLIDHCVAGWSSTFNKGLVALSGGLDSSIVASSLAHTTTALSCINMVTQARSGDERAYARAAAAAADAPLHEAHYDWRDVDLGRSVAGHFPKPIGQLHEQAFHAAVVRRAVATGSDAIVTGNGGDNVFYNTSSVRPIFDRLMSERSLIGTFLTMRDICTVTGANIFQLFRECARFLPTVRSPYDWQADLRLLAGAPLSLAGTHKFSHPWLDGPRSALPGKRGHVAFLLRIQNHLEGYLRAFDLPMLNPLMSQPIVEFALGLPSWRMIQGGRDRMPARRAYASRLPQLVLARRRKGSPSGFALEIVQRNSSEIRSRLHEGHLAKMGWIDLEMIDRSLVQGAAMGTSYVRILAFLDMEAWIDGWR